MELEKDGGNGISSGSMKASANEGLYNAVMMGTAENYVSAFGVFLEGTAFQIGMLSTFPRLVGAFVQPFALRLMRRVRSRRLIMVCLSFVQALLWVPIGFIPFVLGTGPSALSSLIALVAGYYVLAGIAAPVWSSLIGDLIPAERRGRFLAHRNSRCAVASFVSLVVAGQALSWFQSGQRSEWGFLTIFGVALVARLVSVYWMAKHDDPPATMEPPSDEDCTRRMALRRIRSSNFGRFVRFHAAMNFAIQLCGPFFSIYLLKDLGYSYSTYTILTAVQMLSQVFFMRPWGRLIDRFGSREALRLCGVGVAVQPFLWMVSSDFWAIMAVELYTGVMWAGFGLAASNFVFDSVSPEDRPSCVAYQSIVNACFVVAGSTIGAWLLTSVHLFGAVEPFSPLPGSVYPVAFAVSGVARILAVALFIRGFTEVREVRPLFRKSAPAGEA